MDEETLKAMQEEGCVYLAQVGGCAALYSKEVNKIKQKIWEDVGPNLVLRLELKDFGPLIVAMDGY